MFIHNRDGVGWWEAPKPFFLHLHRAQTSGNDKSLGLVQRCPCGAFGPAWVRLDRPRVGLVPRRPNEWVFAGMLLAIVAVIVVAVLFF